MNYQLENKRGIMFGERLDGGNRPLAISDRCLAGR